MDPEEQASSDQRMYATWAYIFPIVGPLLLIATRRDNPVLWRHAIQALGAYGLFTVLIKTLELVPPVAGVTLAPIAIGIGMLFLIACALLVYRGHAVRLPWIADFADKWQALASGVVGLGVAKLNEYQELALHRRNLKPGAAVQPKDVLPKVEGTQRMNGFHIEFVGWLGKLAVGLLGERMKPFFTRSEIFIEKWPLRLGGESRMRFRSWPRKNGSVERIVAQLFCVETLRYQDDSNRISSNGLRVHGIAVADAAAGNAADGSTGASWTLHVPREGPPSFAAAGGGISWLLQVEMRFAKGPPVTQSFDLVVEPKLAAP